MMQMCTRDSRTDGHTPCFLISVVLVACTSQQEHLDQFLTPEQKLRMDSLRKEAQAGGDVKETVRQQLEDEGSMLGQLKRKQQEDAEQQK